MFDNIFVTITTGSMSDFYRIIDGYIDAGYKITLYDGNFAELRKNGEKPVTVECLN